MKVKTILASIAIALMPLTACASNDDTAITNDSDYMTINITIDGKTMTAILVDNSSTRALVDKLQQSDVTYTANDYGSFEKVGAPGFSLPRNDQYVNSPAHYNLLRPFWM